MSSTFSSSRSARYSRAVSLCSFKGSTRVSSSESMSSTRVRFCRVFSMRRWASNLRVLYLTMPAASSNTLRLSSERTESISSIRPWPMRE